MKVRLTLDRAGGDRGRISEMNCGTGLDDAGWRPAAAPADREVYRGALGRSLARDLQARLEPRR